MAKAWAKFPYPDKAYDYTAATLKKHWPRLHRGDAEPLPEAAGAIETWIAFHRGDFQTAAELGAKAGGAAAVAALKAQVIHATYLEKDDARKLALFEDAASRAEALQKAQPENANAHYMHAYALGRYAQGISIAKALVQGIGAQVKVDLERTLALAPKHADAHIASGTYHAEIIDKVGAMIGALTYGAKKELGLKHFQTALKLNPDSAIARIEYANGLVMLEGKKALAKAEELYGEAAGCVAADAMERLDVELAKAELDD
jgi:hypothetical protein